MSSIQTGIDAGKPRPFLAKKQGHRWFYCTSHDIITLTKFGIFGFFGVERTFLTTPSIRKGCDMAEGIILAGGYSSRMVVNKMMIPLWGKPLIVHAINALKPAVSQIIVVTGHYHEEMVALLEADPMVRIFYNENYPSGMFSSVQCGVRACQSDFFILPGDYPLVKTSTFDSLKGAEGDIRIPTYHGQKGHPIYFSQKMRTTILSEPITSNLRVIRDRHPVTFVAVEDDGILKDVDSKEDWHKILTIDKGDGHG